MIIITLLLGSFQLHAGSPQDWHAGDIASQDVRTPVALDLIDAEATAKGKEEAMLQTPAIFTIHPNITNTMAEKFTDDFALKHADFLTGLKETFNQTSLSAAAIQSPSFETFVKAFNARNDDLPVPDGLARQWASGEAGQDIINSYLAKLLQATSRPVLPDTLPEGLLTGDSVRLVPYHSTRENLTLDEAEQSGEIVNISSLTTVTRLRGSFRRTFPAEEKLLAHGLASYIHSNLKPDKNLTQVARDRAASLVSVTCHYDAGQLIVRNGQVVDTKILAALARLNEIQSAAQPAVVAPVESQPAPTPTPTATPAPAAPGRSQDVRAEYLWMGAACSTVSVVVLLGFWRLQASRRTSALSTPRPAEAWARPRSPYPPELGPQLAELLKSAVVQEMASQRHQLLQVQQQAAAEIVQLMQRLNEVRAPLQERLAAYEQQIQELEKELGQQSKENRELLRMQIDLLKEQVKAERAASRLDFN